MKSIYSFCSYDGLAQGAYAQQTTTTKLQQPLPPSNNKHNACAFANRRLPGIGTTLNQDYNSVGINPANLAWLQAESL